MISDLWTLQSTALGAEEKTLAAWGFTSAVLDRVSQGVDTLTLTAPAADGITPDDLWDWEEELVLYRDGEVFFRGYVAETPRMFSGTEEATTYVVKSAWWLLERLHYLQAWDVLASDSTISSESIGRYRLGDDPSTRLVSAMFSALETYAVAQGVDVAFDASAAPPLPIPPVEGQHQTVAQIVQQILRWYPDATLAAVYTADGTTFRLRTGATAGAQSITIGSDGVEDFKIRALPEQQVDMVRVIWETSTTRYTQTEDSEDAVGGYIKTPERVLAYDDYPAGSTPTRRSLVVTLPGATIDATTVGAAPESEVLAPPDSPPQPTAQPVQTETYPETGAYDSDAEDWWLERAGLAFYGLTGDNIRLPRTSSGNILAHRVVLDASAVPQPPSAVNPNSTLLWSPTTIADVPRELISGALSDWMNVQSYPALAEITIAVSVTAVDALSTDLREAFLRRGPERYTMTIDGSPYPAYLVQAAHRFTATDAVTKTYTKPLYISYVATSESAPVAATEANLANSQNIAKVAGLAQRLYESRNYIPHAGSVTLVSEEVPATDWLGKRLAAVHADRPEWAEIRNVIQQVSQDLGRGRVDLTFGPPEHLAAATWTELLAPAREAQRSRAVAASAPPKAGRLVPIVAGYADADPEDRAKRENPIVGPSITPRFSSHWTGAGGAITLPWDLEAGESDGTWKLIPGKILDTPTDLSSTLTIGSVDNEWSPSAGDILRLKITGTFASPTVTLEMGGAWTDHPAAYETTGSGASAEFTSYFYPLWEFFETRGEGAGWFSVGDLWGLKLAPNAAGLLRTAGVYHKSGDLPFSVPVLVPYHSAISAE